MSDQEMQFCTDEEIFDELKKLGYTNVPPEIFQMMKKDLMNLVSSEKSLTGKSDSSAEIFSKFDFDKTSQSLKLQDLNRDFIRDSALRDLNPNVRTNSISQRRRLTRKIFSAESLQRDNKSYQMSDVNPAIKSFPPLNRHYSDSNIYETDRHRFRLLDDETATTPSPLNWKSQLDKHSSDNTDKSVQLSDDNSQSDEVSSINSPIIKVKLDSNRRLSVVPEVEVKPNDNLDSLKPANPATINTYLSTYKNNFKKYKLSKLKQENIASPRIDHSSTLSDLDLSLSSMSINGKLKRKVLRHSDGRPIITEEFIDIPSVFSTSYPETLNSSKSFTNGDLSFKSNSSTGSLAALSPESISPRSMFSTKTKSSFCNTPRRKKNDPVAMYNYYRKFWDNFKPPGEKTHDKLRWAVRDKMLDYNL